MVGESKIVLEAYAQRVWSGGQGNAHEDMLVDATRLDMKLCCATVERDAEDFGTQADGGLEVDGNLARSSLRSSDFQRDAVDVFGVVQVELCRTEDRKSTRLNSSHPSISYAVFCLKKKK